MRLCKFDVCRLRPLPTLLGVLDAVQDSVWDVWQLAIGELNRGMLYYSIDLRVIGKGCFFKQGGPIRLFLVYKYTQVYLKLLVLVFYLTICLQVECSTKLILNTEIVVYSTLVLIYKYTTPIRDNIIQRPCLYKDPKQEFYKLCSINYFIYQIVAYQLYKIVYKDKDKVVLYTIRSYRLKKICNKVK